MEYDIPYHIEIQIGNSTSRCTLFDYSVYLYEIRMIVIQTQTETLYYSRLSRYLATLRLMLLGRPHVAPRIDTLLGRCLPVPHRKAHLGASLAMASPDGNQGASGDRSDAESGARAQRSPTAPSCGRTESGWVVDGLLGCAELVPLLNAPRDEARHRRERVERLWEIAREVGYTERV